MNTKIEKSLAGLAEQSNFAKKYSDLIRSLLALRKESRIQDLGIDTVKLGPTWEKHGPELKDDMKKMGYPTLMGFKIR